MRVLRVFGAMLAALLLFVAAACGGAAAPSGAPVVTSQEATADVPQPPQSPAPEVQHFASLLAKAGWAPPTHPTAPDRVVEFNFGNPDGLMGASIVVTAKPKPPAPKPPTVAPQPKPTTAKPMLAVTIQVKPAPTTKRTTAKSKIKTGRPTTTTAGVDVETDVGELEALVRLEGYFGCMFELDHTPGTGEFYLEAVHITGQGERDWEPDQSLSNPGPADLRRALDTLQELATLCRT